MGREIRRVPAHWEHPEREERNWQTGQLEKFFMPLYDESYSVAITEWIKGHESWLKGEHPDQAKYPDETAKYEFYAQWSGNPPAVNYYRPDWKPEEMTWYQVYETVSEGTPVTPPFETKEELIAYLVENGDSFSEGVPWTREGAEKFLQTEWAPSGIIKDGKYMSGIQALDELEK
jgi:hypothetical protein